MGRKVKHTGKIAVLSYKLLQSSLFQIKDLSYGKCISLCKCLPFQFSQKLADAVYPFHHSRAGAHAVRSVRLVAWEIDVFFDVDDRIDPESGNPLVQPPVDHIEQLFFYFWVLPVQIRLFFCKHMEIIKVRSRYLLPGASAKIRPVVAGRIPVLSLFKIKISRIFSIRILKRFLEPLVFTGAVINHQIHHYTDPQLLCLGKQSVKILHGTEYLRDLVIVRNIISLIDKRRLVNR